MSQAKAAKSRLLLEIDQLTAAHEKETVRLKAQGQEAVDKALSNARQKWQLVRAE